MKGRSVRIYGIDGHYEMEFIEQNGGTRLTKVYPQHLSLDDLERDILMWISRGVLLS